MSYQWCCVCQEPARLRCRCCKTSAMYCSTACWHADLENHWKHCFGTQKRRHENEQSDDNKAQPKTKVPRCSRRGRLPTLVDDATVVEVHDKIVSNGQFETEPSDSSWDDVQVEPVRNITAFLDDDDEVATSMDNDGTKSPLPMPTWPSDPFDPSAAQRAWHAHQWRLAMTRWYHANIVACRHQWPSGSFYPHPAAPIMGQ